MKALNKNILLNTDQLKKRIYRDRILYLMLLPGFAALILFRYVPMYGILMAFQKYRPGKGIWGSEWVGLDQFIKFFSKNSGSYGLRSFKNTIILGIETLIIGFPFPIILALMFNEVHTMWFKKAAQTISYMPYFISVVVIIGIMKEFFALNTGKINDILAVLEFDRIDFFAEPGWFRFLYIFSGIWQTVGYNSIIYLAAIAGVNPELYEVAELDGASRFKRIIHVTIPGILPTILVLFILSVGGILGNDWVKITLMYNSRTMVVADVIGTYLYRMGIGEGNFSFSTAIGLMGSVIGFGLLYTTNWVIRKFTGEGLW